MKLGFSFLVALVATLVTKSTVLAHTLGESSGPLYRPVFAEPGFSLRLVLIATALLAVLLLISTLLKKSNEVLKRLVFWSIVAVITATTITLASVTILINLNSWSKGPVHWHADFQFWACGRELNLKDPAGRFSNKIGSPELHEHNDSRIHFEGVVLNKQDAMLDNFFHKVGGELTATSMLIPTNDGLVQYKNGDTCRQFESAALQVFVYRVNADDTFTQTKLADPATFIMAAESQVPPGDCIIVEFDRQKDRTNRLCRSFEVAKSIGRLKGETP